jgi:hypothetical protein
MEDSFKKVYKNSKPHLSTLLTPSSSPQPVFAVP